MAQTTSGMTFCAASVEVSDDDATWISLDDWATSVAVSGGDRAFATAHTFEGDTPIVKFCKRGEVLVTVRYVYTEEASPAPFEWLRAIYEAACGGDIYVRFHPTGEDPASGFVFSTGKTSITKFVYPQGDVATCEVVMGEFEVVCGELTKAAYSSP